LADRLSIPIKSIDARDVDTLVREIGANNRGIVVVVGHSNTVPSILTRLGWSGTETISETEYDKLFIVTRQSGGASVVRLRY